MPGGRPSDYTPELGDVICRRIALGESVLKISRDKDMPGRTTIWRWSNENEEFRDKYTRAKTAQMDYYAEQLVDIADSNEDDTYCNDEGEVKHDTDHIQRAKLRIDTRKWVMARLAAKKYGDKQEQHITGDISVTRLVFTGEAPPAIEHGPDDE